MGQYWKMVLGTKHGDTTDVIEADGAKLMEFSWWGNYSFQGLLTKLYHKPRRIALIGDYAEREDIDNVVRKLTDDKDTIKPPVCEIWGRWVRASQFYDVGWASKWLGNRDTLNDSFENMEIENLRKMQQENRAILYEPLYMEGGQEKKVLLNHDTREYLRLGTYYDKSKDGNGRVIAPIHLLCAIGNGRGGGDYDGTDMEAVGRWAWNLLSLEDCPGDRLPKDWKELNIQFRESR